MIRLLGPHVIGAVALLVSLIGLYAVLPALFPVIAVMTFVVALVLIVASVRFFVPKAVVNDKIISLRVRAQDQVAALIGISTLVTIGALLVARAFALIANPIDRGVYLVGISFAVLMLASPALNALVVWRPWRDA